jgi:hypothetical protein
MSQEEATDRDVLHIGNLVGIFSEAYGYTVGRIIYRSLELVRIMPQDASDRAVEFPMTEDGSGFRPDLGVSQLEILEEQESDYYVDMLGAREGEVLEFFTATGEEAAPPGEVAAVIKTAESDAIRLTDDRLIEFGGIGPEAPIVVVRVRSAMNAAATEMEGVPADAADAIAATERQDNLLELLRSVLPAGTMEVVPTAERTFPDSMQREDLFQDLMSEISAKKRTNPRRIRLIEREVDLAVALKNRSILRDAGGRILGPAPHSIETVGEALSAAQGAVPAAIPVVTAARVLNIDKVEDNASYKRSDVVPRVLDEVELESELMAQLFLDGKHADYFARSSLDVGAAQGMVGRGFVTFMNDLLGRDQVTLDGPRQVEWREDQDVIRTGPMDKAVQGLAEGLPGRDSKEGAEVTLQSLMSDVPDRSVRVLTPLKYGSTVVAPTDPSTVSSYVILPPKAALALRPPKRAGDLPTALLYSAASTDDNLPTVARALADLYSSEKSALNAWNLEAGAAGDVRVAEWLDSVLKYAVHPVDSLGPRTPALLSLLDTLGIGERDLAPDVAAVISRWNTRAQRLWKDLLVARRKDIQAALDSEGARQFHSVTGDDSPVWPALREAAELKELMEDIRRRNPTISEAPTTVAAALMTEAQGDATPLVWYTLARLDSREVPIDPVVAKTALDSSRAYALRRKALRDFGLLSLHAAPEINTCPHVNRLEAIRNVMDVVQRSRLLRDFIDEYQGAKQGEWMTCVVCNQSCVCYHELMELEALAQPARLDAIQKQMLIRFGGGRYEGKIACKNCGQGLQDIDYDEHVEFDDEGNPITGSSVLTEEQMEDENRGPAIREAVKSLVTPAVTYDTQIQQEIGAILQTILERTGLQMDPEVQKQVVRFADLYVSVRAPTPALYEKQRTMMLTAASAKLKEKSGKLTTAINLPTYADLIGGLRIAALSALTALALQTAVPAVTVSNPFPLCKFSREGWPLVPTANPDEDGAISYVACAVASIDRDFAPWRSTSWSAEPRFEARKREVLKLTKAAVQLIVSGDPKTGPLPFTLEIRDALSKAQTDTAAMVERALISKKDQLPVGFRPEPFPPKAGMPAMEQDPVPGIRAALAGGEALATVAAPVVDALKQQSMAVISDMHGSAAKAVAAMTTKPDKITSSVCCPAPIAEVEAGALLGLPEMKPLLAARDLLRGSNPVAVNAGTHLWQVTPTPVVEMVEQRVEDDVLFKLFLKYCYRGPSIGHPHEFSTGNTCRQCGLALGKPLELVDFGAEGQAILARQLGDLKIEITAAEFERLSGAVRRSKQLTESRSATPAPWRVGLEQLIAALRASPEYGEEESLKTVAAALDGVLGGLDDAAVVADADRAVAWAPFVSLYDQLMMDVTGRIGPIAVGAGGGQRARARAEEAKRALATFDTTTESAFIEGPRFLQEFWCAKATAAGSGHAVTTVTGSKWANISTAHNEAINKLLNENANWYGTPITESTQAVLRRLGRSLGPALRTWIRYVRPAALAGGAWTDEEARVVLRAMVAQVWADAMNPTSWMYRDIVAANDRTVAAATVADWTRALMIHASRVYIKYSKEKVQQMLQQRAELDRTSIVNEIGGIKDDDERAAVIMQKNFKMGRWARGENIRKLDADTFEFEAEQRHRQGIVDAPVDPLVLEGARGVAGPEDYGLGGGGGMPEAGYDTFQGAAGDDY